MVQQLASAAENGSEVISDASELLASTLWSQSVINRTGGLVLMTSATQTCIAEGPGFESRQVHLVIVLPVHLAH